MPVYNANGWLTEATPAQRRTLWESAMQQLAAIHRVPVATSAFVDRPEPGAPASTSSWPTGRTRVRRGSIGEVARPVAPCSSWLHDQPAGRTAPAVVGRRPHRQHDVRRRLRGRRRHGLGAGVPQRARGRPRLVVDLDEIHSVDPGVPRLDGLGTRQETIELWEDLTGQAADDLLWHEVFAGCKSGAAGLRSRWS